MLARGDRLIVQGSGHAYLADPFRELAAANPRQVAFIERFDRVMARRIYAGADAFVMPSRFEPCGQGQMIALRYGTPPIVHRTGGLADTVIDEARAPGAGTGFVFDDETAEDLLARLRGLQRDAGGRRQRPGRRCSIAGWRSTSTGRRVRRRGTWTPTGGPWRSGAADRSGGRFVPERAAVVEGDRQAGRRDHVARGVRQCQHVQVAV